MRVRRQSPAEGVQLSSLVPFKGQSTFQNITDDVSFNGPSNKAFKPTVIMPIAERPADPKKS